MASRSVGVGIGLPPHLLDLLYRLNKNGRLFIELHRRKEKRMQEIASRLGETSKIVNKILTNINATRMFGVVFGGLGIALAAAVLAGGSSAGERTATMAAAGGVLAFSGFAGVITANLTMAETEKMSTETVEMLVKEFIEIVELLKDVLEEIQQVSEDMVQKSSSITTTTGVQAKQIMSTTQQLQQLLRQTAELAERSKEVLDATLTAQRGLRKLLNFIIDITRITPDDAELRNCITGSASQCEEAVAEFVKMRNMLKDFDKTQTE